MILYHGSWLQIEEPDLIHFRPNVDFGRGFYVTPLHEQTVKWCGKSVSAQRKHWGFCALKGVNKMALMLREKPAK